jgi:hypothetical protein
MREGIRAEISSEEENRQLRIPGGERGRERSGQPTCPYAATNTIPVRRHVTIDSELRRTTASAGCCTTLIRIASTHSTPRVQSGRPPMR